MKNIKLDDRLSAVADYISIGGVVADIGTDHAYLPCSLIKSGISKKCYAADINDLPLMSAKSTVIEHGLTDKVKLLLSDGLSEFDSTAQNEITDIVIAGMGGELIVNILKNATWVKNPDYNLILQPMTKAEVLREYLFDSGYILIDETACIAANKRYTVINAKYNGASSEYTPLDLYIGKLKNKNDFAACEYKKMILNKLTKSAKGRLKSDSNDALGLSLLSCTEELEKYVGE